MRYVAILRRAVWTGLVLCVAPCPAPSGALQAETSVHRSPASAAAMVGAEFPYRSPTICSGIAGQASSDTTQEEEKLRRWRSDLRFIVRQIESRHPNPWLRTSRAEFTRRVDQLEQALADCSEEVLIVRAMQLVASLGDGHTALTPFNHPLAPEWFPIRMDRYADGIFVTAVDKAYAHLAGGRVLRIGKLPSDECFRLVGSVTAADSPFAWPRTVPTYLSNAAILRGLGVIADRKALSLEVVSPAGTRIEAILASTRWPFDGGWTANRSVAPGARGSVTAFTMEPERRPLHLKEILTTRKKYWYERLPDRRALYFQFNSFSNGPEPFPAFVMRMWEDYDRHADSIDRVVVDLRYNEGGNGEMVKPLLHELIKREARLERGRLYVVIGSRTFSAAMNLVGQMTNHTSAITVGDVAGPVNWFSDTVRLALPSERFGLDVSTMFWQAGHALDTRGFYAPECPVPVTAGDEFAGRDRALEDILDGKAVALSDVLAQKGFEAFRQEYTNWVKRRGFVEWPFPYSVFDLRRMGADLFVKGRKPDAMAFFTFVSQLHPDVPWVWEILGNVLADAGEKDRAIQCLQKALDLNPYDIFTRNALREVKGR